MACLGLIPVAKTLAFIKGADRIISAVKSADRTMDAIASARTALKAIDAAMAKAKAAPSCDVNSFTPDTEVLLADGNRKKIKDLRVGDQVSHEAIYQWVYAQPVATLRRGVDRVAHRPNPAHRAASGTRPEDPGAPLHR